MAQSQWALGASDRARAHAARALSILRQAQEDPSALVEGGERGQDEFERVEQWLAEHPAPQ